MADQKKDAYSDRDRALLMVEKEDGKTGGTRGGTKPPQKKQAAWTSPAMQTRDGNLLLSKFQEPQISRLLRKQERKRQYGYTFAARHIQGVGLLRCIA